ncbi:MAG: type I 3-dehydroquinate dehydratase [Thermodesulfobacteriota bacterium]
MNNEQTEKGRICVSIARADREAALRGARRAAALDGIDVIEIRLDTLFDPAITPFVREMTVPLLFTNRPVWEGGYYEGPEEARLALLHEAVAENAAFVDIELAAGPPAIAALCRAAHGSATRIIASWHDFHRTPSAAELGDILARQQASGAHLGKMVTMAHDFHDVLRVLQLQETAHRLGFPLSAFCMGRAGMISRLATLELGGFMTYAALDSGEAAAPGQLAVADLLTCLRMFSHGN